MKVRAVVFSDKSQVEFREVTVPEPGPNDVVVETRFSWISNGTEGSCLRGERVNGETPYRPGDPWPFPIAPGYQSSGVVERAGADVTDLEAGQWVFCTVGRIDGMYEPYGGHISRKVVDRSEVWPIPKGVPPEAVSGLVLTQVGYNCGTRPALEPGDCAVVIGDGLVGHWAAQTLHWRGANVILAGKHDDRLGLFKSGERRSCVNVTKDELEAPEPIKVLVDAAGSVGTIMACLPSMAHNGHIVSAGFHGEESLLDIQRLRFGEQTLHSPSGWRKERMDKTLALVAGGQLEITPLITHRFPAYHAPDAWRLLTERTKPVLGVVLKWT